MTASFAPSERAWHGYRPGVFPLLRNVHRQPDTYFHRALDPTPCSCRLLIWEIPIHLVVGDHSDGESDNKAEEAAEDVATYTEGE